MARHPPHRQRAILDFERNVSVVMAANLIVASRINPEWRDASSRMILIWALRCSPTKAALFLCTCFAA